MTFPVTMKKCYVEIIDLSSEALTKSSGQMKKVLVMEIIDLMEELQK